jgi:hypothetical protein
MTWQMKVSVHARRQGSVSIGTYFGIRLPCHPLSSDFIAFHKQLKFPLRAVRVRMCSQYSRVQGSSRELYLFTALNGSEGKSCGRSKLLAHGLSLLGRPWRGHPVTKASNKAQRPLFQCISLIQQRRPLATLQHMSLIASHPNEDDNVVCARRELSRERTR